MADAGRRRGRRRLAGAARRAPARRVGPDVALQGNLDPARVPGARGRWSRPRSRDVLAATTATPATCSTSATASCPRPTRRSSSGSSSCVHAEGRPVGDDRSACVVMAYGTPASPDDVERVLHPHPPGPAAHARAAGRPASAATTPSAASRRCASAPRPSGPARRRARPPPARRVHHRARHEAQRARSSRTAWPSWPRPASSGSSGLVLAPHYCRGSVGEYVERLAGPPATAALAASAIESWHAAARADSTSWPRPSARRCPACRPRPRCSSPPTASRSGCSTATPTPTSCGERPTRWPSRLGLDRWAGWGLAWQSAGRTPEPWRGPDILDVIDDLAGDRPGRGGRGLPPGLRRRPPRGPLRPRHRGPPAGRGPRPRLRPHPVGQRRRAGVRRPGRPGARRRAGLRLPAPASPK